MSYIVVYLITCLSFAPFIDEEFNSKNNPNHWSFQALLTFVWPIVFIFVVLIICANFIWDFWEYLRR